MSEPYVALSIDAGAGRIEELAAELLELGFEGFEERDGGVVAFVPAGQWTDTKSREVSRIADRLGAHWIGTEHIAPANWNAEWERGIRPVVIPPFEIIPPWESPGRARIPIVIEPKMSFGTAHHETTRLLLRALPEWVKPGFRVLDAGTGTGILAIAALKLGAAAASGFDIDPWSVENARENAERNGVSDSLTLREGTLDEEPTAEFDLILANINRNALIAMLPGLLSRLARGAVLLLSGLLTVDEQVMREAVEAEGGRIVQVHRENDWIAMEAMR